MIDFEWDSAKAAENRRKHRIGFEEAGTAFEDPMSLTVPDPDHSESERRFLLTGMSAFGRLVVVSHAERGSKIRLISARIASRAERKMYEEI